jgi:hypothetical protein
VTDGSPKLKKIPGTALQWITNTKSDVFYDETNKNYYLLVSGRWFNSAATTGGWAYVPGAQLPADFARIPADHPRAAVLVSVPGTPEAREALIAAAIPQTATIDRATAKLDTSYDGGSPAFKPIPDTNLQYAMNSEVPVIEVSPTAYYAVKAGVWFTAPSPTGPWSVATSVPPAIYTIPPSSPIYNVTYVRIYGSTPSAVYTGYTPGYYGTLVAPDQTVVYGTGYDYAPYVGNTVVIAPPATYGNAAAYAWGTATGFLLGAATSAFWGPGWGYGWAGGYYGWTGYHGWGGYYGAGGWGGAWSHTSNAYGQWGNPAWHGTSTSYGNAWTGNYGTVNRGTAYNARTGTYAAGGRVTNTNAYTGATTTAGRGATYNPATGRASVGHGATYTNPNTGQTGGAAHGATYNPRTGQTNTWSAAKVNNNVYASRDGQVYKAPTNGGGWQHYTGTGGGWQSATHSSGFNSSYFNNEAQARSTAQARSDSFNRGGWGGGASHAGGWGGGFRGGGGWGGGFRGGRR